MNDETDDRIIETDSDTVVVPAQPAVEREVHHVEATPSKYGRGFFAGMIFVVLAAVIAVVVYFAVSDDDNDGQIDVDVPSVDVDIDG